MRTERRTVDTIGVLFGEERRVALRCNVLGERLLLVRTQCRGARDPIGELGRDPTKNDDRVLDGEEVCSERLLLGHIQRRPPRLFGKGGRPVESDLALGERNFLRDR